jgi:hypothetical protein
MSNRKEKLELRTYRKDFQFECQIGKEHYFQGQIGTNSWKRNSKIQGTQLAENWKGFSWSSSDVGHGCITNDSLH